MTQDRPSIGDTWGIEMNELRFDRDIRSTDPNETGHRKARFCEGWRKGAVGERYGEESLKELTWDNLGYRLGTLFSDTSPGLVDELYDWCVRQQREKRRP
jgi:hypothetical protein